MPAYSPGPQRTSPLSPADSAIGGDSDSQQRAETDFSDEREENFECFGESGGQEFERLA